MEYSQPVIAIVNISADVFPFGEHTYELRINRKVIATFKHKREEGLTKCLQLAAAAAEKAKWEEAALYLDILKKQNDSY